MPDLRLAVGRFSDSRATDNRQRMEAPPQCTLERFAPRFIEGYARTNRQKPSGIAGKETILRVHLVPLFGAKTLDAITNDRIPCTVRLLPTPQGSAGLHDFEDYERPVTAAKALDARTFLIALLGGEAGLRCGEMMALEWSDVDLTKGQMCVERSDWKGQVTSTKGGRLRYVP